MLPRPNRLKKKKEIEKVFKYGRGFTDNYLWLKVLKTAMKPGLPSRFGFIVSQKISKKAVIRNKVRRRLSEAARLVLPELKMAADCILIAKPGIQECGFNQIKTVVRRLFIKANIL